MTIKLRDYQVDSLEKLDRYLIKGGGKSGIWHLATGLGKTVLTTHAINEFWDPRKGYRSLIVGGVNRVVTFQMLDALRHDFPYMNGNMILGSGTAPLSGIVMGNINQVDARVLVASIQSLVSGVDLTKLGKIDNPMGQVIERSDFEIDRMGNIRKAKNSKRPYLITPRMDEVLANGGLFDVWIHDECFAAGTLIDDRPIETIQVGDTVTAFNDKTKRFEQRKVVRLFKHKPKGKMVRIIIDGTELICTANHPIYTQQGWVKAEELNQNHEVLRFALPPVRKRRTTELEGSQRKDRFLEKVGKDVLFGRVPRYGSQPRTFSSYGGNQSQVCFRTDEEQQPDVQSRFHQEDEEHTQRNGVETDNTGWQWQTTDRSRINLISGIRRRLATRMSGRYTPLCLWRVSNCVQDRCGTQGLQGRYRDRWQQPYYQEGARSRQTQSRVSDWIGVDSVTVLEPTSDGTYSGLLPDGLVYNFEVEGLHTYTANRIVVHNCHHSVADGSVYVIRALDNIREHLDMEPMRIIGNTATPARADDRGLHTLYERVIASYPIDWAQRHGYLVPFTDPPAVRIMVDTVEVDQAGNGTQTSDKKQTIRYVDNWAEIAAQGYHDEMAGRKCFAYWSQYNGPSAVEDSIYASNIQNSMGIRSVHVDGQKCIGMKGEVLPKNQERKLLEAIAAGRIDVINNHHVLIEGVNVPAVDGIILGLRVADENPVTITQIIGRALRLAPGKKDMKLLEVTGKKVTINSIADLTGYAVDPLSGGYIEKLDPYGIVQLFMQLWATRTSDVERWILTQKRFKESTIREAIDLALRDSSGQDLADTHLRALNDCNKALTDENTLIDGMDLKDVRQDGMVRGINQSYELIKIEQKSAGTWYVDNHSALMSISLSKTDSFVIHPPNHTYARIARAACEVIVGDDDTHPLIRGKTIEQREKMMEFFTTCQRFYQNFTLWHLCGEYYAISLKQPLWVLEDEALDVLESDALAYGRDNIENYTAKFSEKKKAQSWKNDEATLAQHKAASQVLGVPILALPEEVKTMSKGAIAKFINHNACVKYLEGEKSPIPKLNAAIERIKEIV